MPRKPFKIQAFHGGINSKSDKRDIGDTQLAEAIDISIDDLGMVTNSGAFVTASVGGTPPLTSVEGHGLFRFSSDYDDDYNGSATPVRTDYLFTWNNADKKFYWSPGGGNWATPSHLDTSSDWAGSETPKPMFYNVDGAIRVSDGAFNPGNNPLWIGIIDRVLFTDGVTVSKKGWFKENQELAAPSGGLAQVTAPSSIPGNMVVHWHIRNIQDETDALHDMDEGTSWAMNDTSDSDEHLQVEERVSGGYGGTDYYRRLGWKLISENDDASEIDQYWRSDGFTNSTALVSGKALYLAVRVEDMDIRNMWAGTHSQISGDDEAWSVSFTIPQFRVWDTEGTISGSTNWVEWDLDLTGIQDSSPGEWVILELAYDKVTKKSNAAHTSLVPKKMAFFCNVAIQVTGGASVTSTQWDATFAAIPVMHISDLRLGDVEKTGSSGAKGDKKFAMSFTYDDNEDAESLLYNMSGQNVALHPNDYGYKIGITAHLDTDIVGSSTGNSRITGSNLYMFDEDIPYRVARLDFIKGLKGAWEGEYPADRIGSTIDAFAAEFTTGNKSNSVETTGLPLLESYESLNGFKPNVKTTAAKYAAAVVLNRKVYIGNIEQDGKRYGDRMIKSVNNSFDVFPSSGRELDVVNNDGDDIIKLETYADRILQFKRNTMYLINATKSAEFLEDTFVGKGVVHPGAVCRTDFGVAWVNENGCYLYDGKTVKNLTESVINEDQWARHINSNSQIFYFPSKRKLFVTGDWTGGASATNDLYEYSLSTQGWTKLDNKAPATKSNFVFDGNLIKTLDSAGVVQKWDDTYTASSNYLFRTKDIDFGSPGVDKRLYKVYVTYKSPTDTNVQAKFDVNGGTSYGKDFTTANNYAENNLQGTAGEWAVATLLPDTTTEVNKVKSFQLQLAATAAVPKEFAINDITFVFRERIVR